MKLQRNIGLTGGVALVVGGIIGVGAYVLIPAIAYKAGHAGWLAICLALAISLISVLPIIQLSSALPVAGGGYMYVSRLLSPLAGLLTSSWALIGGACSVSLVSVGLVQSLAGYLPFAISPHIGAAVLVLLFYAFYFSGLRVLSGFQILLSAQLILALLVYAYPILWIKWTAIQITLPATPDFFVALILAMNISLGFQIIIEMGEEIVEPKQNIPLALLIGAGVILLIYLFVLFAYTFSGFPLKTPMAVTAEFYLPPAFVRFFEFGMISAALTTYNGAAITLPREIFSMSRDKTLPGFLSAVNDKGSPINATTAFFALVIAMLLLGQLLDSLGIIQIFFGNDVIEYYGFMTIMGIMLLTVLLSLAAWRLSSKYPQQVAGAYLRFTPAWLKVFIVIAVLSSLCLMVIICTKWLVPVLFVLFSLITIVYYYWRKQILLTRGWQIGNVFTETVLK